MKNLTIIVPAFNEEESLPEFLEGICDYCLKHGCEIIIVNDGSSDSTAEILTHAEKNKCLRVIHNKVNKGYGGAIKAAVNEVRTDYLITIDADGQHSLDDIETLYNYLGEHDADMVVGRRDKQLGSRYRRFGKFLIRSIARVLMDFDIEDLNSGMKIYRADLARKYSLLCPDTMAYSDIITLVFINQKHRVLEKDIQIRSRLSGTSTINTKTALDTIMEILNIVILFNPNKVFLPLAGIFVMAGVIWGLPFLLRGEGVQAGTLLLTISGLLFFLLGLIAEQLSLIRRASVDCD